MANIYGNRFDNELFGTTAGDRLHGRDGNDILHGNGGRDVLFGDGGDDSIYVDINPIGDTLDGGIYVFGGTGFDTAIVDMRAVTTDIFISNQYDEIFYQRQDGSGLAPSLVSLHSIESLTVYMGSGNDYFHSMDIRYDSGATVATAYAGGGDDRLIGGRGRDIFVGESGNDVLFGYGGNDGLSGGDGDDYIDGGDENDVIFGDAGNDIIYGGANGDEVYGGDGDDRLFLGTGNDRTWGDAGDDIIYGENGNDSIVGGTGNDRLVGGAGEDGLTGQEGDDLLYGGDGSDSLDGGVGNDRMYGGMGQDGMSGGAGSDRFVWYAPSEGGDRITQFKPGEDLLLFDGGGFGGITAVDDSNFVSNSSGTATDADDRFIYGETAHTLYFDPDGNGAAAAMAIARFYFTPPISAEDFFIV